MNNDHTALTQQPPHMTTCPICQHPLHHKSPPLLRMPPLKVYCDGCGNWLTWEPTDETRKVRVAPLCPACKKPMVLKNLKAGGTRYGCETWKECKTGMRGDKIAIDVPVYRLVARVVEAASEDEQRFSELWRERQRVYARIEEKGERWKRDWWNTARE